MRIRFAAAVMLTVLAVGPTDAQVNGSEPAGKFLAEFEAAFNLRDAAKLASLYAEDAVVMPPGAPVLKGRTAIEFAFKSMVTRGGALRFNPPLDAQVMGERAFAAGTYTLTVTPQGSPTAAGRGTPQVFTAKYLTVFKRVGNDWKVAYDMQNADQPPPR